MSWAVTRISCFSSSTPRPRRAPGETFCHGTRKFHGWLVTLTLTREVFFAVRTGALRTGTVAGSGSAGLGAAAFFWAKELPQSRARAVRMRTTVFMVGEIFGAKRGGLFISEVAVLLHLIGFHDVRMRRFGQVTLQDEGP